MGDDLVAGEGSEPRRVEVVRPVGVAHDRTRIAVRVPLRPIVRTIDHRAITDHPDGQRLADRKRR